MTSIQSPTLLYQSAGFFPQFFQKLKSFYVSADINCVVKNLLCFCFFLSCFSCAHTLKTKDGASRNVSNFVERPEWWPKDFSVLELLAWQKNACSSLEGWQNLYFCALNSGKGTGQTNKIMADCDRQTRPRPVPVTESKFLRAAVKEAASCFPSPTECDELKYNRNECAKPLKDMATCAYNKISAMRRDACSSLNDAMHP